MPANRQVVGIVVGAILVAAASCGPAPGWEVDVVNRDGPIQVSVTTDRAAWQWIVPPGSQMVLLRESAARPGSVEIHGRQCNLLGRATFSASSFTIIVDGIGEEVRVRLEPGAMLSGPANLKQDAWCSG